MAAVDRSQTGESTMAADGVESPPAGETADEDGTTRARRVLRTIHVLGLGAVGKFMAHSLRELPRPPPVSLLFHKRRYMYAWREEGERIELHRDGHTHLTRGYAVECVDGETQYKQALRNETPTPIDSLILATKSLQTAESLRAIAHRLHPQSTIVFLQNGMGVIEEVNAEVFPDPTTRPHYMIGINSHGVRNLAHTIHDAAPVILSSPTHTARPSPGPAGGGLFSVSHTGLGALNLGILPREPDTDDPELSAEPTGNLLPATARYLMRTLTRAPILAARGHASNQPYAPQTDTILLLQLEKLAINAVINPLTALLDVPNAGVMHNYPLSRTYAAILAEISELVPLLPELANVPPFVLERRFSVPRLASLVLDVATRTARNSSSMREDVRNGRRTEVGYINGFVARRAHELGLECPRNELITEMVDAMSLVRKRERDGWVPLETHRGGEGRSRGEGGT